MTQSVLLDNVKHHDLKVRTDYAAEFGDGVNQVLVFPSEYQHLQREYPILFFRDNDSGEYQSVALLGLDRDENLYLDNTGWQADYVPAVRARGPFLIGLQSGGEPMIHVDMSSPRISRQQGEPVFLPHGGNTPYLERISGILQLIHRGASENRHMFEAFAACDLIAPVKLELKLSESEQYTIEHFSTINEERLAALNPSELASLHRAGFLKYAFLVVASLNNISRLIEKKKRVLARAA